MFSFDAGIYGSAVEDFRRARSQADLKQLLARLRGENTQLLSYDEVRQMLRLQASSDRGLKDIPLDAIIGSVGRTTDFTRDFLPRRDSDRERWARVKAATARLTGLPPIEVYQIGDVYFVKDGNHRVSVARQMGAKNIHAYVIEVRSRVPLTPDIRADDLILKAETVDFLEQTHLDQLRPYADLSVSIPGQYQALLEHIQVHRYYMGLDLKHDISAEEAVAHWYDVVYLPVVTMIHEQGLLRDFPGRTEADLYLWIAEHRSRLEAELGWDIRPDTALRDLARQRSQAAGKFITRQARRLISFLIPDALEGGPPPGKWRADLAMRPEDRLVTEILAPVDGKESGWYALEQAMVIARREPAVLRGLYVLVEGSEEDEQAQSVRDEFIRRCQEAGVEGLLAFASGEIVPQICKRAVLTDLVVVNLLYPPPVSGLAQLSSGFVELIRRCTRPVLATPRTVSPMQRPLLAYDGSPMAEEALFLATYLAERWALPLVVVTAAETDTATRPALQTARRYLEAHQVQATYLAATRAPGKAIQEACVDNQCDLIIMGGYRHSPVLHLLLDSTVDQMLRQQTTPILICR